MEQKEFLDLIRFMKSDRFDLVNASFETVLGLTGHRDGISLIFESTELLTLLLESAVKKSYTSTIALKCLVNLTTNERTTVKLCSILEDNWKTKNFPDFFTTALNTILDQNSQQADLWTMILNNISSIEVLRRNIILKFNENGISKLVSAFADVSYNKEQQTLDLLAGFFQNLTNIHEGREIFCSNNCNNLGKIVSISCFNQNFVRKSGVSALLKNICLEETYHSNILNNQADVLCFVLYPLAGPEQFTDEQNEKLPFQLQYLEDHKKREENPEIRLILLETLLLLCATKISREILRERGTYDILRMYYNWEFEIGKNKKCLLACENIIHILIKKEVEIGVDNLKSVEVPDNLIPQFNKDDEIFIAS